MSTCPPCAGRFVRFRNTPRFNYIAGWQYLILAKYRKKTHERWRNESYASVAIQIIGGIFSMVLTGFLAGLAALAAWILL